MSPCPEPGCQGILRADGYCGTCGIRSVPGAPPEPIPGVPRRNEPSALSWPSNPEPPAGLARTRSAPARPFGPLEMAGVPSVPYRDPKSAILPAVPTAGPDAPKLAVGELVGGHYEVRGCIDRGGFGWIYLAYDNNVGQYVVLKGLVYTGFEVSAIPEAERAALASVNHRNIVQIHNFVPHRPRGASMGRAESYIVMEYVPGLSLKRLLEKQRENDPQAVLPVRHVIAYGIETLRALEDLHARGMVYCDLKPANIMQCEQRLTVIDLGATRPMDGSAAGAPILTTPGYRAPEVTSEYPSISHDLYTVGRTMARLSFPPFDYKGEYEFSLPPREQVDVLRQFESYERLLRRATHPDPARRFHSAAEMAEQLFGVLREVVSAPRNAEPWPVPSTLFGRERRAVGVEITAADGRGAVLGSLDPGTAVAALPVPVVSESDQAIGLADLAAHEPAEIVETLTDPARTLVSSAAEKLVLAGAYLELGGRDETDALLNELTNDLPGDWRVEWYRGVAALAAGDCETAREHFDDLYTRLPGEAAPKLALAFCCEGIGDQAKAASRYESVWRTDHGYLSAAFGLARVRLVAGDRDGAMRALDEVPPLSRHYGAAQLAAMAVIVRGRPPAELSEQELREAAKRLEESRVDGERRLRFDAELLEAGLAWLRAGRTAHDDADLLGAPLTEDGLRRHLEGTYRELARLATDIDVKHALVKKANGARSRTFI